MPKKIAFVFDENSKNDVSSDDIADVIELSDGRYIVIPKLQGAIECSPTPRAVDWATTCGECGQTGITGNVCPNCGARKSPRR